MHVWMWCARSARTGIGKGNLAAFFCTPRLEEMGRGIHLHTAFADEGHTRAQEAQEHGNQTHTLRRRVMALSSPTV